MKKYIFLGFLILLVFYGLSESSTFNKFSSYVVNEALNPKDGSVYYYPVDYEINNSVKVASFNIQVFGRAKAGKADVVEILSEIIRKFDIISVQEIRDSSETAFPLLMKYVNNQSGDYSYIISERLGRSSSKEQYAFIYKTSIISQVGDSYVYDDKEDVFEREPFIAGFKSKDFDFTLVNIHTKPDDAKREIHALSDVVKDAGLHFPNNKDVIVLGDFNADGSYFDESINSGFRDSSYLWIVPDSFDTTVAYNAYAYDRIVAQKEFTEEDFTGVVSVFHFDEYFMLDNNLTESVSDHYPVWAAFYTNEDTD